MKKGKIFGVDVHAETIAVAIAPEATRTFSFLRQFFRTVLAVKGSLRRAHTARP